MSDISRIPTIPYSAAIFNEIGTLQAAAEALEARKAETPNLLDLFRQVFVRSGKNNAFGIALLHKHFPIAEHQVLVELNTVTTPWTVYTSTIEQIQKNGIADYEDGKIHAISWMLVPRGRKAKLMPFEFSFTPNGAWGVERAIRHDASAPEHQDFAQVFADIIESMGLQDVIALTAVPETDFDGAIETRIEKKNVLHLREEHNVASPDHPSDYKHKIQASFFWPTESDGTIPVKAKGTGCEGWDTCKATVKDAARKDLEGQNNLLGDALPT